MSDSQFSDAGNKWVWIADCIRTVWAPPDFQRLINTAGGAQESRFVGGSQLVSVKMAAALHPRVVLRAPVRRIAQSRTGVTVETDAGTWRGRQVIVAVAPTLAGRIA